MIVPQHLFSADDQLRWRVIEEGIGYRNSWSSEADFVLFVVIFVWLQIPFKQRKKDVIKQS